MASGLAAWGHLSFVITGSSNEYAWSTLGLVTPILTEPVYLLQNDEIYDETNHDTKTNTANIEYDLSNGLGDNQSESEPPTQYKIASVGKIAEEQR